jgi:hypothetical protein
VSCSLTFLVTLATGAFLDASSVQTPADKKKAEYADPTSTYRTYLEAVRKNDTLAAKKCWMMDGDDSAGALDVIVGFWIAARQLHQVALQKFGKEGGLAIPKGWRRNDVTDQAIDVTKKRLEDVKVETLGDTAELKIKWKEGDGFPTPAFEFRESTSFRKVDGNWKIDANRMTGLVRAADLFEKSTWGPMFRDQLVIMKEAVAGMETGKLNTAEALGAFIGGKVAALRKKHEKERKQ